MCWLQCLDLVFWIYGGRAFGGDFLCFIISFHLFARRYQRRAGHAVAGQDRSIGRAQLGCNITHNT